MKISEIASALERLNLANATLDTAMQQWREASGELCRLVDEKETHDAVQKARKLLADWAMNQLHQG